MPSRSSSSGPRSTRQSSQRRPSPAAMPRRGGRGPRPPQPHRPNYTLRRILVAGGFLLVFALLVWLISALLAALSGSGDSLQSQAPQSGDAAQSAPSLVSGHLIPANAEATRDGILDDKGVITIPKCLDSDLSMALDTQVFAVGAGVSLPLTVTNTGQMACSVDVASLRRIVTSGEQVYFHSGACESQPEPHVLLLSPGSAWSGQVSWDGRVYQECTPIDSDEDGQADVAQAGTYVMRVNVDAGELGSKASFVLE